MHESSGFALLSHHVLFNGLLLRANLCGNVSPARSTCHHIALAFRAKCTEGGDQIPLSERDGDGL